MHKKNRLRCRGPAGRFNYQTGAEMIEFVITLPVILIVLAIIFDFGVAFTDQTILTNATRAAVREVIQGADDAQAQLAADRITVALLSHDPSDSLPAISINRTGPNPGDPATVSISHRFGYFLLPGFLAEITDIELTATTVMNTLPN